MIADIRVKRVYAAPDDADGLRVLVDALWPRGIAREKAMIDLWLKEVAPSHGLRKRTHGDPANWHLFPPDYAAELADGVGREALERLRELALKGPVTLLYAAKDEMRNNATVLADILRTGDAVGTPSP
ncbi:DUF488 domain-containing protein [Niveispirillum sp. KHB5.9]|uniref:DUF488 domain-containing protein n=1 Tax=Niveispirillum sp. KHB5.9 TaxID=3400269 RepID=UPI003A845755